MINTTLGAIDTAQAALARLASKSLPAKTAYQIAKLLRLADPELKHFIAERNKLVVEFGEERKATPQELANGSAKTITEVTAEQRPAFFEKIKELSAIPVTLDAAPIDINAVGEISGSDLLVLDFFVVDPSEAQPAPEKLRAVSQGRKR